MKIAIVGFGPRGLAAAETLADLTKFPIDIDVFDPSAKPAAGLNFAPDETHHCLLNLPKREINLPHLCGFPDFQDWTYIEDHDDYPARAELGRYLQARLDHLIDHYDGAINTHQSRILDMSQDLNGAGLENWSLRADDGRSHGPYAHVLLTMGQPATAADKQWQTWQNHAENNALIAIQAYPTAALRQAAPEWDGKTVAIRGLALTTLDVLALLTLGQGGKMQGEDYIPSGKEPARILPFSLDGLPPAPKPIASEEPRYTLDDNEAIALEVALTEALGLDADAAIKRLSTALIAPAARITGQDPREWLMQERLQPGTQRGDDPLDALKTGIAMSLGEMRPDPGYAIGQIWRKWQNPLRDIFRKTASPAATRLAIVGFDNTLKRYSYGPPLKNARLLLALIRANLVQMTIANEPDIQLTDDGWQFDNKVIAQGVIDAVLPSPQLQHITDPLISALREAGQLTALAQGSGVHISPDGAVLSEHGTKVRGLSLLGRLGEGSTIAADSIHDCFGSRTRAWAASVTRSMERLEV